MARKWWMCCVGVMVASMFAAPAAHAKTVRSELARLLSAGAIAQKEFVSRRDAFVHDVRLARRLTGQRRLELQGVLRGLEGMAARGSLTASRLRPLWANLEANRFWWTSEPLPASGQRVSLPGSELVYQYFPGQGIQFHPLANFGKLNGLWQGRIYDDRLAKLLDELEGMSAVRAGGVAWEYYFDFDGGRAPWVSSLAQGTALQALARAAIRLGRKDEVFAIARQGLGIFRTPPPAGVLRRTDGGAHYLQYSFAPRLEIANGFVQSLNGLFDFAKYANDDAARALFADGATAARAELPRHDTGFWSLYSRGSVTQESNLHYHVLLRDFLRGLCNRTLDTVFCDTTTSLTEELSERPVIELLTRRLRGGTGAALRFSLSKIAGVTVRVANGSKVVLQRGGTFGRGERAVGWRVPRKAGVYAWRVIATDLAGNTQSVGGELEVLKARRRAR